MKFKRAIIWTFAVLTAAPILLVVGLIVFNQVVNAITRIQFSAHESNQKVETLIAGKAEVQDVSSAFLAGATLEELEQQLYKTGFTCETETSRRTATEKVLVCRGKVTKDAFCTHSILLVAEFEVNAVLRSVLASNEKNC